MAHKNGSRGRGRAGRSTVVGKFSGASLRRVSSQPRSSRYKTSNKLKRAGFDKPNLTRAMGKSLRKSGGHKAGR